MTTLIAFLIAITAFSQGEVVIGGSGTGTDLMPINHYYNYNYTQMIYDQEAIPPGEITAIKFKYASTSGHTANPLVIYMKTTDKASFNSSTDFDSVDLAEVFSGSITSAQGWVTIELDNSYMYDGTGNLLIAVDNNTGDCPGSYSSNWYNSPTSAYKTINTQSDNNNTDPLNPVSTSASAKTRHMFVPSITIVVDPTDPGYCFAPENLAASNLTTNSIDLSWTLDASVNSYNIEYKKSTQSWTDTDNIISRA